jgi:hypothetical protein
MDMVAFIALLSAFSQSMEAFFMKAALLRIHRVSLWHFCKNGELCLHG